MFRLIATITMILFLGFRASAQEEKGRLFYIDQIDAALPADFFEGRPEAKERYVELLRDRLQLIEKEGLESTAYVLLSSVQVLKNAQIKPLPVFDPLNFNPLIYDLDFFGWDNTAVYRIDGTNYYIVITPQIRK